jgi:hypothetical protein
MLSFKLFGLVFCLCLFRFNRKIETLCFGIEAKQPKETEKKQNTGKTLHFLKKYQNMLPIKLFRLVFCLFGFNRNIETLCFDIEEKQQNKCFVSDSAETSYGCFESKLVSKDTLHVLYNIPLLSDI